MSENQTLRIKVLAVELTYDDEADAAYIELAPQDHTTRKRQVWASPKGLTFDLVLDIGPDGRILGIEILGARSALRRETLDKASPPS